MKCIQKCMKSKGLQSPRKVLNNTFWIMLPARAMFMRPTRAMFMRHTRALCS